MANEHIREVTKMIRLIDAERFNRILQNFEGHLLEAGKMEAAEAVKTIIKGLKTEPTVDAVEVVHGHNTYDHDSAFECSVCGWSDWDTMTGDGKYNYFPNCGAKMDGDGNG